MRYFGGPIYLGKGPKRLASPQTSFGFVCHAFISPPWTRNECVTNEPQRTSAGRLPKGGKKRVLSSKLDV